jgi:hypothetical protein
MQNHDRNTPADGPFRRRACGRESRLPKFPHAREFLPAFTRCHRALLEIHPHSSGGIGIAVWAHWWPGRSDHFHGAMMSAEQSTMTDWTRLIQAEYRDMPGLILTKPQIRRLWGLDPQTCDLVLDTLVATAFLQKTPRETYALSREQTSRRS